MSSEYNLQAVRELMVNALDAGQIIDMAQDIFPAVYRNFSPGMTADQHVRAILDYAGRHGRMETMLNYIRERNPAQYDRHADNLHQPPPDQSTTRPPDNQTTRPPDFNAERLAAIHKNIEREQALLTAYEEELSYESDSRRKMKIEKEIARQKAAIERYRQEAAELGGGRHG